jgi:hypothetical protein
MSQPADWAIEILASDEEILVPVKKLWKEYVSQTPGISLEEFTQELEAEDRIELMAGTNDSVDFKEWSREERAVHDEAMEACGWFSGPPAKLKSRTITLEHIVKMIEKHTNRMVESLADAYDVRPVHLTEDDERSLFDVFERAVNLRVRAQGAVRLPGDETE